MWDLFKDWEDRKKKVRQTLVFKPTTSGSRGRCSTAVLQLRAARVIALLESPQKNNPVIMSYRENRNNGLDQDESGLNEFELDSGGLRWVGWKFFVRFKLTATSEKENELLRNVSKLLHLLLWKMITQKKNRSWDRKDKHLRYRLPSRFQFWQEAFH